MHPAVRFVRWTVLGSVLLATLVATVLAGRSPSSPQSLSALFGGGTVDTQWGPLGASDRDMLIKVRQANLWEGATGEQAAGRAVSPAVREVGRKLGVEHAQLDASLRAVADQLGVRLPSQPSDQQKVWMDQIAAASPDHYDSVFINVVRSAHGEVMPLVEGVRSGTQNELVRKFAIQASQFIGRHMEYLESTGLVDYALFPPSTAPAARLVSIGGYTVPITLVLFLIAVLVSAALLRELGRSRRRSSPPGRTDRGVRTGRRRDTEAMVTTGELIAVLNPVELTHPLPPDARQAERQSADRRRTERRRVEPSRPAARSQRGAPPQRPPGPDPLDRRPPKLRRTDGNRRW